MAERENGHGEYSNNAVLEQARPQGPGALQGSLPGSPNYLGLLFGVLSILSPFIPPRALVGAVLGVVWGVWLGVVLLRSVPGAQPAPA